MFSEWHIWSIIGHSSTSKIVALYPLSPYYLYLAYGDRCLFEERNMLVLLFFTCLVALLSVPSELGPPEV